ncbi:omh4 [Symbiodinium natans]|uniref:Omh4 protein n=1 Tax=Symbiodinium natans TaxID=878477 RepID=A0A812ILZ0_9DINO|nr:omh4 [Symbiodinium natans]
MRPLFSLWPLLVLATAQTSRGSAILYVEAQDGLEDKLEPDEITPCLTFGVLTLRKSTLTVISEILKKLGDVMDTSAEPGPERFLLFAAMDLIATAVHLLDVTYLLSCARLGCEQCGLGHAELPGTSFSVQSLFASFGRKATAFCHMVESSIDLTESTLEIRQREPPIIWRRSSVQQVRDAIQDLLTSGIAISMEELPAREDALVNLGGIMGQGVRLTILQLLDAIPDMASEARHLPKGVPAWSQRAAAEVLEASGASSATLQEMLFLLPLPPAGWPATRASPLCEKRSLHSVASSRPGSRQAQIAAARRDAAATTTWLGASPSQLLKITATSSRPLYRSYVAIRNAGRFGQEASCEEAVGILYDPTLCLGSELGLSGVIYFLTMDPEIDDPLYVRWIGRAWSGQTSQEQPVWQSTVDPILKSQRSTALGICSRSLNPMAGNCQTIWEILQADSISTASIVYVPVNPTVPPPLEAMR